MSGRSVTCTAPVNIAVIKYWGKRDEELILPINSSLSVTLSQDQLCAKTTVMASPEFTEDRIWLNGKEESVSNKRLQNVLKEVKRLSLTKRSAEGHNETAELLGSHVHICSENNFPTAAGLASSAAGYACLVFSLCKLFGVEGNISKIARVGSGSACRSLNGGFVAWRMGEETDGSDSVAEQVAPQCHWPQLKTLILVVSAEKKSVGSTAGMGHSVATSQLLAHRASSIVPQRMMDIEKAIQDKDFQSFAKITMQDSNQFHATCLDTYPPIMYLNDTSRKIINLIHSYNDFCGSIKAAYTFDAGPNACIYLLEDSVDEVASLVTHFFPRSDGELEIKGIPVNTSKLNKKFVENYALEPVTDGLSYVISTEVGDDPRVLDQSESLLDAHGLPKNLINA